MTARLVNKVFHEMNGSVDTSLEPLNEIYLSSDLDKAFAKIKILKEADKLSQLNETSDNKRDWSKPKSTTPLFDFTFYHGSPDKIIRFEPVAPNMGNQLEPPKWVVYMFMNKNYAHKFALQRVIQRRLNVNHNIVIANYFDPDSTAVYCLTDQYDEIKKNLLGQKYYVYTLKVDPDTIGVGHSTHLDEYTTTDPHPRIIKADEVVVTKEFLEQNLVALDKDKLDEMMSFFDTLQRPTFANIMLDPKDKNKRFKAIMKMLHHGSIVPRVDNLQDVVQSIMQYEKIFKDFPTIDDLGRWIWDNVSKPRKDEKFIWPEELLKTKVGTCIDIAVLLHQYCNINHIQHEFGRVGIAYTKDPDSKIVNHQCHIVLLYKITDKKNLNTTWNIIQNEGPDRLRKIVFKGNSNIEETLELFAKAYLPGMIKELKSQYPKLVVKKEICQISKNDAIGKFDREYFGKIDNKTHANKQAIINNMFEKKVT